MHVDSVQPRCNVNDDSAAKCKEKLVVNLDLFFDLRRGANSTPHPEMVTALLNMCEWADQLAGVEVSVTLPEHHGFEDGYLSSPIVLGSAIGSRTRRTQVEVILLAPFYHPVRLAEDLAMLDLVCRGRLGITLIGGYVDWEFEMFAVDPKRRGELVEEMIHFLRNAWTGEEFEHDGNQIRVSPRPYQRPGPQIVLGGSSRLAARRAARHADGFYPTTDPKLKEMYREELAAAGKGPVPLARRLDLVPPMVAVTRDPDRVWEEFGPYSVHEANFFNDKMAKSFPGSPPTRPHVEHWSEFRDTGRLLVLTPEECIEWARGRDNTVTLVPLYGGMDPAIGWESLELIKQEVLPALADSKAS